MSVIIKSLGSGQLTTSQGALYTATGTTAIVMTVRLVNTHTAAVTVNLYFKGAASRQITPKDFSLAPGALLVVDEELTLGVGDSLEGKAGSATKVDYVVSGVERPS